MGARFVAVLASGAVGWSLLILPATAHDGAVSDAVHAQQDLVGESITKIEQQTAANAAKIKKATGARPGTRQAARASARVEQAQAAASTDPGRSGSWSAVVPTEVVPVFQAVLPNGKVLIWDSVGDMAAESTTNHTFTRVMIWNPADDSYRRVDVRGYNIFCSGYVQLANGNVLVAGGNKDKDLNGIKQTHLFDWKTETWSRGPDMASERWYPSLAAMANGEVAIVAGGTTTAEVYQTDNTLRRLTGFASYGERLYPFLVPRPDGLLQQVGAKKAMMTMDTSGAGAITATAERDGINRDVGSFATYAVGKTLVAGGGKVSEDGQSPVPTRTAVVVDTNVAGATSTKSTGSMAIGRRQYNLTVLADGSVLATGGETKAVDDLVDLQNAAFAAERWDPATGAWTTLASASRVRQYHSTASLLPDGRVMTGGGGVCGRCTTKGYLEKNIEYFTPPYLYKSDGSGQLADRPVIGNVPSVIKAGRTFTVTSPQAKAIRKVGLVRLGAPTHGVDQGQRYIPLTATASGTGLTVSAPATAEIAPPGYYMLFLTDSAGVPSVAKIMKVEPPVVETAAPLKSYLGTCVGLAPTTGGSMAGAVTTAGCTTDSLKWTFSATDETLRTQGKCLSMTTPQTGSKVVLDTCTGGYNQRWERRSDATIRFATSPSMCLSVVGQVKQDGAPLELASCKYRAGYQAWSNG